LEYNKVQKKAKELEVNNEKVTELVAKKEYFDDTEAKKKAMHQRALDRKERENRDFWEALEFSEDPYDNLEGLAQHIHNNISSTGVYVG
jgi:hypothetical protein